MEVSVDKVIVVNPQKKTATRHKQVCGNVYRVKRSRTTRCVIVWEQHYNNFFPIKDHNCIEEDDA